MAACSQFLFLLVLLSPLPAITQRETRHEKFLRQHNDFPKTDSHLDVRHYCNLMMQRRGMTNINCKPSNTFIHGSHESLDAICREGGTHHSENYYDSNAIFEITACRIMGNVQKQPCNYRGRVSFQRIRVACQNGEPVHFKSPL
ncbi:ribonuclease-like [Varanus komodoensis]|uniref:Ribonuclease A-domain domain-containing protein n=1 Tax=Varanus komodoensis TaxID=61221 RepID=A0A8D2Q364_VARKO|nr:ribonuclease-like [Varanus komodoensis]